MKLEKVKRKAPTDIDQLAEELEDLSAATEGGEVKVPVEEHNLGMYHQVSFSQS